MKRNSIKKCAAMISAAAMICCSVPSIALPVSAATNLITNSTFDSGTYDWGVYKESGGSASLSTNNGRLALNVSSVGKVNYAVQAYYDIVPLYKNGVYHFHYEISSTIDRTAEGMIQLNSGDYHAYTWKELNLSSTPLVIDYDFVMEDDNDIMAKLVFNCGTYGTDLPAHTIYIDNVSLELVDDSRVDYGSDVKEETPIITNQVGYKPESKKIAVFRNVTNQKEFSVVNASNDQVVYTGALTGGQVNNLCEETDWNGDFSAVTNPGKYYIKCGNDKSYTFEIGDNVYSSLLDDSVRMLYLQRCGTAVQDSDFGHQACHTSMAKVYGTNNKIDVSGGWHDAGDYGRYVVPGAKAVADLLYAYDAAPDLYSDSIGIPESNNGVPDILDEARYELEWMLKMQDSSGGVHHKVTCENFPGFVMPENETAELIVTPISSTATADFCASMAMAYEFYMPYDKMFANECLAAAEKAWSYLEANPQFDFTNPSDITTGDYGDKTDLDERYWATAQMYRATKNTAYLKKLESLSTKTGLDWSTVGDYGNIAILTMDDADTNSDIYDKIAYTLIQQADKFVKTSKSDPYAVSQTAFAWGSNMTVANSGNILGIAYKLTGDTKYLDAAEEQLNYLLGKNPLGTCFVTGYGTVSPQHPHHRPSVAKNKAMKGMLVGGVDNSLEDSAAKAYLKNAPLSKRYIDNADSYSTNEITIYWNSPLTYLISLTSPQQTTQPVKGDVNADGQFSVADIVMLQKWLLNDGSINDWQAGELVVDGVLDIFDLIEMKKLIK